MRVQLHWIARIHVVYLKQVDSRASLMNPLPAEPLGPQRKKVGRAGAKNTSRKKELIEPGSLRGSLTYSKTNTNLIEQNYLFCILSPVPLLPRALRNRSDHIDIPSTQHRSSKGSRTIHQSTKARIRKLIPISRVHNRMDKLTLTRQFWIQLGIFLGRYQEEIGMS